MDECKPLAAGIARSGFSLPDGEKTRPQSMEKWQGGM